MIERCFGIIKNSYCSVSSSRFRNRRYHGPIFCNLIAALFNRRKILFQLIRRRTGYQYMNWTICRNSFSMFYYHSVFTLCKDLTSWPYVETKIWQMFGKSLHRIWDHLICWKLMRHVASPAIYKSQFLCFWLLIWPWLLRVRMTGSLF